MEESCGLLGDDEVQGASAKHRSLVSAFWFSSFFLDMERSIWCFVLVFFFADEILWLLLLFVFW